jgi:hypothetical protein
MLTSKPEETSTTTAMNFNNGDHVAVAIPAVEPPITTTTTTTTAATATGTGITTMSSSLTDVSGASLSTMSMRAAGKISDAQDDELLHRAVADAGRWAYGTIFVEVWLLNEKRTELYRPEAGWWIDPIYHLSHCVDNKDDNDNDQLSRLTHKKRSD